MTDSTQRFSNRVENYVRYRPGYPADILALLEAETGLANKRALTTAPHAQSIADIGSGTGLSAELFLRNGQHVLGVEPNAAMRQAAERLLQGYAQFHSVEGTAEATKLPDGCVDYVVAAQAFHWFDPLQARREFSRILRPNGWVVLIWNDRRTESTPFLRAYEALIQTYGTDYQAIAHKNISPESLQAFFADGQFEQHQFYNEQRFDFEGLKGRSLSSSYMPNEGHERYTDMVKDSAKLFERYAENGKVTLEYDTDIYFGH